MKRVKGLHEGAKALRETGGKGYGAHLLGKWKGKYLEWKSSNTDGFGEVMEKPR